MTTDAADLVSSRPKLSRKEQSRIAKEQYEQEAAELQKAYRERTPCEVTDAKHQGRKLAERVGTRERGEKVPPMSPDAYLSGGRVFVSLKHTAHEFVLQEARSTGLSNSAFMATLVDVYMAAQRAAMREEEQEQQEDGDGRRPPRVVQDDITQTGSVSLPSRTWLYVRAEANALDLGVSAFFRFLAEYYRSNREDAAVLAPGRMPAVSTALLKERHNAPSFAVQSGVGRPRAGGESLERRAA
jgi:hypothetical protein